jgi:SOS response regulatory protein OraA/RecX
MDNQEPDMEKITQALYGYAAQRMKSGASDEQIVSELRDKGLNEEIAQTIVSNRRKEEHDFRRPLVRRRPDCHPGRHVRGRQHLHHFLGRHYFRGHPIF